MATVWHTSSAAGVLTTTTLWLDDVCMVTFLVGVLTFSNALNLAFENNWYCFPKKSKFFLLKLFCSNSPIHAAPVAGGSCSKLISEVHNISEHEPSDWHYGICPDVEECRLRLDDCHPNATCHNTFQSFECTCNRGFMGNGHDTCDMT